MLLILCDAENILRTTHYRMYCKYLIGSHNVKELQKFNKIKYRE